MAGTSAGLRALARVLRRDLDSFQSIKTNNFFLFILLLVYGSANSGMEPKSAEPLMLLLGFLLFFPLSSDPLGRVPASRLALWPFTGREKAILRLASLALSPVLWIALAILAWTRQPMLAAFLVLGAVAVQVLAATLRWVLRRVPLLNPFRWIPAPPGILGELIRKNIRQMFSVLDMYVALLLSIGGAAYRLFAEHPDPAAFPILALVVVLALSTYAQCLFGFDLRNGMTRYRLMPLPGWQVLLSKDLPYLALLLLLVLPLDVGAGMTFAFVALAVGHHSSVLTPQPQQRWRFTGSQFLPGVIQALVGTVLGFQESQGGPIWLAGALLLYVGSVFFYGRRWDRR